MLNPCPCPQMLDCQVGSIQMEWQYLSRVTGNPVFEQKVDKITEKLKALEVPLYTQVRGCLSAPFLLLLASISAASTWHYS
jgi:hypothetical protein